MSTLHLGPYQAFISSLIEARRTSGQTQAELAKRLGRPQSFVSKVETLERRLDVVEFLYWCKALGVSPETVFDPLVQAVIRRKGTRFD